MNERTLVFLLVLLAPCRLLADTAPIAAPPASAVCRQAIAAAERGHHIPPHLLAAIARVESGRRDEASGSFNPWPWTINLDGQGSFYDSKAQAMAAAQAMRGRATRSIDIGCMQISLTFHPDAFPDLGQAFDPVSNADYGARFLVQLFEKTGSWPKAVQLYHSATPELGHEYGSRVYAALPQEQRLAELTQPPYPAGLFAAPVGRSSLFAPLRQGAPHVVMQPAGLGGGSPAGRSLDAYRAAPVRLALRAR